MERDKSLMWSAMEAMLGFHMGHAVMAVPDRAPEANEIARGRRMNTEDGFVKLVQV